jgi:microcompartment protein CcmK/EutM
MPESMTMPVPVAVVDALNSLLEAEQGSIFRFMGEGSPYLSRATGDVRRPLQQMVESNRRHIGELWRMIEDLGGEPRVGGVQSEEQYLAFLSLKFLLPKLVDAKNVTIRRYENALKSIGAGAPGEVKGMLEGHLAEHRQELGMLEKATALVLASNK